MLTLNEVIDFQYGQAVNQNGIFHGFLTNATWLPISLRTDAQKMTFIDELYMSRSGNKYISPYLDNQLNNSVTATWINARARICSLINTLYTKQWKKLFDAYDLTYDPVDNYDMTESMTNDITTFVHGKTETKSFTNRETEVERDYTRTPNLTETITSDVYGYNSANAVHDRKQVISDTGTEDIDDTVTTKERGTETLGNTGTDTNTRNYTLTRSGNIGVTTSQQMLQSEFDLWGAIEIFQQYVFPALDNLITLPIY